MACCCGSTAVAAVAGTPTAGGGGGGGGAAGNGASGSVAPEGIALGGVDAAPISVVVRVRPPNARETAARSLTVVESTSPTSVSLLEDHSGASHAVAADRTFGFDAVLGQAATQADVYGVTGAPILAKFIAGFNACIFAYGQTGSGKTYTMEGAPGEATKGVMPRLAGALFTALRSKASTASWVLEASYIEIYLEAVHDLLSPTTGAPPASPATGTLPPPSPAGGVIGGEPGIRQTPAGEIVLEGVARRPLHSEADLFALLAEGTGRRTKGETAMNAVSSRSHAVLSLYLTQHAAGEEDGGGSAGATTTSKLHLIDLAGSERADLAATTGARLREGAKINLSLSALGNVINALSAAKRGHVPFRDSKLTRLLQDSLGGNAFCLMVLNISPSSLCYDETLSSLRFAERAKKVKGTPRINVDPMAARIAALEAENRRLRERCAALEAFCTSRGLRDDLAAAGLAPGSAPAAAPPARAGPPPGAACCIIQ